MYVYTHVHMYMQVYLVQHVAMDVIQALQLLALGGHELTPVVSWGAIQAPPAKGHYLV